MAFSWLDNRVSAELLELAESVAKATGSLLMNRPDTFTLTEKSSAVDFATQMDQQAEKMSLRITRLEYIDCGQR